jgi:uncharacterized membrane protein
MDEAEPRFEVAPPERRRRLRLARSPIVNLMFVAIIGLVAATVIGLAALWPRHQVARSASVSSIHTIGARVKSARTATCAIAAGHRCQTVTVTLAGGRDKGDETTFEMTPTPGVAPLQTGDRIRVTRNPPPPKGATPNPELPPYSFSDFDRRLPMLWLAILFVVLLLVNKQGNRASVVGIALLYSLALIPFIYMTDRISYRAYLRRIGQAPAPRQKRERK